MPNVKYALADEIKRQSGLDETRPFREHMRAWLQLQIARGMYGVGRGACVASPCSCGGHHATPAGNLFYVAIVSVGVFQRVKDGRYLPSEIAAEVQDKLASTSHMAADVAVVCCETGEMPFHLTVDRDGYTIRPTTHAVKEG